LATLFRHAIGHWGWRDFEKHYQETPVHPNAGVGILLKTLAVVDADSAEEVTRWETEWPVLHSVPMETTSKGAPYYFRRTTLCNELGLTNGPLNKQADFKSIIGTGTAGTTTDTLSKGLEHSIQNGKQTCCTYDLCISGTRGGKVSYAMSYVKFISGTQLITLPRGGVSAENAGMEPCPEKCIP